MFIVLADDRKSSYLLDAAKKLFTEEFVQNNVSVYEYLLDAIYAMEEKLPYVDIGIFDLNFKPESVPRYIKGTAAVKYNNDVVTEMMGINCLLLAIGKAQEANRPFVGTLYTFEDEEMLMNKSLDLRIFMKYQFKQWEKDQKAMLLLGSDADFSRAVGSQLKKMLRTIRRQLLPNLEDYASLKAKVDALRADLYEDTHPPAGGGGQKVDKAGACRRLEEIRGGLKFKAGRQFTFETFFPEQQLTFNDIREILSRPDRTFTRDTKAELMEALDGLILDWRPYTSVLTRLVSPEGEYGKKSHGRDYSAEVISRVKEFEMLPVDVIDDLDSGMLADYRARGFRSLMETYLDTLAEQVGYGAPANSYLGVEKIPDGRKLRLRDRRGREHAALLQLPDGLALNDSKLGMPCRLFYELLIGRDGGLLGSEIVNHAFAGTPPREGWVVTVGFKCTRRAADAGDYDEYVLAIEDNGVGFTRSSLPPRGNLSSVRDLVRDWCEEFTIETRRAGDKQFRYDLFKDKEVQDYTPAHTHKGESGTVCRFVFRVRSATV
jgi:hypothetical protein